MFRKYFLVALFIMLNLVLMTAAYAEEGDDVYYGDNVAEDETVIFRSADPDVLILLDLSQSMTWNVAGEYYDFSYSPKNEWGKTLDCLATELHDTKTTTYPVSCSRLSIAKRALFSILDANGDNSITSADSDKMSVRFGLMTFNDTATVKTVKVISNISGTPAVASLTGTSYSSLYCSSGTSCSPPAVDGSTRCTTASPTACVVGASASGITPLVLGLNTAKTYLGTHKAADPYKNCRQKFVILISDGSDTRFCSGSVECTLKSYKRRRASVDAVKQLRDAGYKVFVIGFGADMPIYLKNTLNWMAYYGGTDNSQVKPNVLPATLYDPALYAPYSTSQTTICNTNETSLTAGVCGGDPTANWYATNNDPGNMAINGYAFLAESAAGLNAALKLAVDDITQASYTFTQASIQAVRTIDENFLYEATFEPFNNEPFWHGHLKRYSIDAYGTIPTAADWDAGAVLKSMDAADRKMYTYIAGELKEFKDETYISATHLNLTEGTAAEIAANRLFTINFTRCGDPGASSYTERIWKLGDIFHSSPVSVGSPSPYYFDVADKPDSDGKRAFDYFRATYTRTTANELRRIYVGANDGQLHAFIASKPISEGGQGGKESWSFIPPNLLSKLSLIAHNDDPNSLLNHQFYVDGSISISDVYLAKYDLKYTNTSPKDKANWRTLLFFGEGRGGYTALWSSSTSCDSDLRNTYSSDTYKYYCGYYALDVTKTTVAPVFKWRLGNTTLTSAQASYLGYPLNKITMGRVRLNNEERWVGFIGGGYSGSACSSTACADTRGKGFYVVDLIDGSILWSYTRGDDSTMNYDLVGQPVTVDTDRDGFVDTVYSGDVGGNMWRFKFCLSSDSCATTSAAWSGGKFYDAAGAVNPIYTLPVVVLDSSYNRWVYFGTGDKIDPITAAAQRDRLYAIRDTSRTGTYYLADLKDISAATATYDINVTADKAKQGWYIKFAAAGEKMLADPIVFSGVVYYTTYIPPSGTTDLCDAGKAYLNAVNYLIGAGGYFSGTTGRQVEIGSGIVSSVLISQNPVTENWDIYAPPGSAGSTKKMTDKFKDGVGGSGTQYLDVTDDGGTTYVKKIAPQNKQLYWLFQR